MSFMKDHYQPNLNTSRMNGANENQLLEEKASQAEAKLDGIISRLEKNIADAIANLESRGIHVLQPNSLNVLRISNDEVYAQFIQMQMILGWLYLIKNSLLSDALNDAVVDYLIACREEMFIGKLTMNALLGVLPQRTQ
jgi:hypothetical protein